MKLIPYTKTAGDESRGFYVDFDKNYSIREFIKEVLLKNEWGTFDIREGFSNKSGLIIDYKYNNLIDQLPIGIMNRTIWKAKANGGWGNMDYLIFI